MRGGALSRGKTEEGNAPALGKEGWRCRVVPQHATYHALSCSIRQMPKQDVNFTGIAGSGMGPITRYWFLFLNLFHLVRIKL